MSTATARSLAETTLSALPLPRLASYALLAIAGTLILAVSAKTRVVLGPVDLSLQTLAVFLIGAAFGWRLAAATVILYLVEGAAGLPVFQGTPDKGIGLAYMTGTTGGYLAGFVLAAAIVGWAADRGWDRSVLRLAPIVLLAEAAIMVPGWLWLSGIIGAEKAWTFGVVPFLVPDLIKVAVAVLVVPAAWGIIERFRA